MEKMDCHTLPSPEQMQTIAFKIYGSKIPINLYGETQNLPQAKGALYEKLGSPTDTKFWTNAAATGSMGDNRAQYRKIGATSTLTSNDTCFHNPVYRNDSEVKAFCVSK